VARVWLRHNINRGGGWKSRAEFTASRHNWAVATAVFAARDIRRAALDELGVFAGLDALAAVAIERQRPIVESYARLSDQDLGDGGQTDAYAVELVDQLAAML
jgi:hypothetical protein